MLKILTIIIICAAAGFFIYNQNIFGVQQLVPEITSDPIAYLTENPLTTFLMTSGGTIIAVGSLAWSKISSVKNTAKKEVDAIAEDAGMKVDDYRIKTEALEAQNLDLQKQVESLSGNTDLTALQGTISKKEEELRKARTTIDTLHETLRRNKLSADEVITKTVVI
jgi:hypothetical protein